MKKAQQLLKEIKNTNVSYAIMDEDNEIYCNKETNNILIFQKDKLVLVVQQLLGLEMASEKQKI